MNKLKRWLAVAVCLCMLCTSGIGELSLALAEELGQVSATAEASLTPEITITPVAASEMDGAVEEGESTSSDADSAPSFEKSVSETSLTGALEVNEAPAVKPQLDNASVSLYKGTTDTFALSVTNAEALSEKVTFTSDNVNIATVDESGKITAVGAGECVVTASAGGASTDCVVTVYTLAESFTLSASTDTLKVGESTILSVEYDGKYTYGNATFDCDNSCVSVDASGKVTALSKGTCTVTAKFNSTEHSVSFTILALPETIDVSVTDAQLAVGETAQVNIALPKYTYMDSVEYTSSDAEIATVDASGKITALQAGECTITATVGSASAGVDITVNNLNLGSIRMGAGTQQQLPDKVGDESTAGASYASLNPSVVTVDENGLVTAVSVGNATITITTVSGVRAQMTVSVLNLPDKVTVPASTINILVGEKITLPYSLSRADGADCEAPVSLKSGNSTYVEIVNGTQISAKAVGSATVYVTAEGGATTSVQIVVWNTPNKMYFEYTDLHVKVGATISNRVQLFDSKGKGLIYSEIDGEGVGKFSIDNPTIATVDASGKITGLSAGVTNLVFTAASGLQIRTTLHVLGLPTKLNLDSTELTLGVGATATLKVTLEEDEAGDIAFASDHPEIATVNEKGTITAVSIGTAVITVSAEGGASATCTVNVVPAPSKAVFPAGTINLIKGTTVKLPVEFVNTAGDVCETAYVLKSSSTKYASVVNGDSIYAARTGTVTITAVASNGAAGSVKVKIWDKPKKLFFSNYNVVLGEGTSETLLLMIWMSNSQNYLYAESDGERVGIYTVDDPNVATVDAAGKITGLKKGETTVRFTTRTGLSASTTVRVMAPPTVVKLNTDDLTIGVNDTAQLTASYGDFEMGTTTFVSENPDVATVTENGKVTAVQTGVAMITATTNSGVSTTCIVTVVPAPEKVVFPTEQVNIFRYSTIELPVEFINTNGDKCETTYSLQTSSSKYVAVGGTKIYGARAGTAYVRVTTYNGVQGIVRVKVWDKPKRLFMSSSNIQLGVDMTERILVMIWLSNSSNFIYSESDNAAIGSFSIADPSVATVDQAGNVRGISKGTTTLTFRTTTGKSLSAKVTVLAQPTELHLNYETLTIGVGDVAQYSASYGSYEKGVTTYVSSNPEIATITESGRITAVAKGKVVITATTNNGIKATSEVNVVPAPAQVVFPATTINILRYTTAELPVEFINTDGDKCETTYSLQTSSSKYVAVGGTKIYGARAGTAYVRVTTYNGVQGIVRVKVWDKPKRLFMSSSNIQLGVDMTERILVMIWLSNSSNFIYTSSDGKAVGAFSTDNPLVATVDSAGNVTGVTKGETTLRFTTTTGLQIAARVTVLSAPTSLSISKESTTLGVGMTETLTTKVGAYEMGAIAFSSSNEDVATVDKNGKVTAKKAGDAIITAETKSASGAMLYAACRVTVLPAPDKIEAEFTYMNVAINGSVQMNVKYSYQDTDNCMGTITYMSSKSSVAKVSATGVITGVAAGNAIIRAQLQNGLYVDCNVTVRKKPTSVLLSASNVELGVDQTYKLYGRIYYSGGSFLYTAGDTSIAKFESSDSSILTIASDGTVTALKPGTAYVRLYTYNGKGGGTLCKFTVKPGPEWITLTEISTALNVNQSKILYCDRSADSITAFTYTSSNSDVVRVVGNGASCTIYGVSAGTAVITASSSNGKTAQCEVKVYALPESISFEKTSISVGVNETQALPTLNVTSSKGDCSKEVTYTSSNASVVKVESSGRVTGVAAGTATITASAYNGLKATCTVTVLAAPKTVQVSVNPAKLAIGDTASVTVKVDTVGSYTLSAEDPSILSIEGNTVTALKIGKTNVVATTYNNATGKFAVEVLPTADSVTLDQSVLNLAAGMTANLKATIPANTLATIRFESSDESVATIDSNGKVAAVGKGTARIYARVEGADGVYDTCDVNVKLMPESIALGSTEIDLFVGESKVLSAKMMNGTDSDCYGAIAFTTNAANVATVSANGKITAVGEGEATIIARSTANANVFSACVVKVSQSDLWLEEREITLGVGESYANTIHTTSTAISTSSTDSDVASMDVRGTITAKQIGTATITVTCDGDTAQCVVTVKAAPTGIALSTNKVTLYPDQTVQLTANVLSDDASSHIRYTSKNEAVAKVDSDGVITAVGTGEAEIVVSTYVEDISASCRVSVVNAPEKIRFAEMDELILSKGDSYRLAQPVIANSVGACDTRYSLSISNAIASLSESDGSYTITATSVGTAVLRAKTLNGKSASLKLTVVDTPTAIEFDPEIASIGLGETYAPRILGNNGSVISATFSSDSTCISVSSDGKTLTANAKGTATITARAAEFSGLSTSITVKVVDMATEFSLGGDYRMGVGENFALTVETPSGTTAAALEYASSNEDVVRVDRNGVVYAIGAGEATITAKAQNDATAVKKIIVSKMATVIEILPHAINACLQDTVQLTVKFASDDEYANVRFDSADDSVATVDDSGLVRFHKIGTTTISAEAYNGLSDVITVQVCETPKTIGFNTAKASILLNDRAQLKPVFDAGACYFTLESSDPTIISIDEGGYLNANKKGTATITVKTNVVGLTAKIDVEVIEKLEGITVMLGKTTLELHETTEMLYSLRPTNLLGSGNVTFESSDPNIATVDASGIVTGVAYGEAEIRVIAGDGTIGKATVNVLGGKRRAFIAYYYGSSSDSGYLPFAFNNAYSMNEALSAATVEGRKYDICGPILNASKSALYSRIDEHFRDATDDDTSILYFCSHGGNGKEFYLGIPNNSNSENTDEYRIYASELYSHISKIKGHVVVVIDSCGAGGLIETVRDQLDTEDGRITVLASSHADTSSSFYSVSNLAKSVDFFTFALLHALGYSESEDLSNEAHGWWTFTAPADANNDGKVTIGELFEYAKAGTVYLAQNKVGGKNFYGTVKQVPQIYASDIAKNRVIFKR